jgi:hypothetical protein
MGDRGRRHHCHIRYVGCIRGADKEQLSVTNARRRRADRRPAPFEQIRRRINLSRRRTGANLPARA